MILRVYGKTWVPQDFARPAGHPIFVKLNDAVFITAAVCSSSRLVPPQTRTRRQRTWRGMRALCLEEYKFYLYLLIYENVPLNDTIEYEPLTLPVMLEPESCESIVMPVLEIVN